MVAILAGGNLKEKNRTRNRSTCMDRCLPRAVQGPYNEGVTLHQGKLPLQVIAAPAIATTTINDKERQMGKAPRHQSMGAQRESESVTSSCTDLSLINDLGLYGVEFGKPENTISRINNGESETAYEESRLQNQQLSTQGTQSMANKKIKKETLKRYKIPGSNDRQ